MEIRCGCKNKELDGAYEQYHRNGRLCIKTTYKDGKRDGAYISYSAAGKQGQGDPFVTCKCTFKNGQRDGLYEFYDFMTGQLLEKGMYKEGKRDGLVEEYYGNGQLRLKSVYKNDKAEGPYEEYYSNGQKAVKCIARNGVGRGTYQRYYEDGQVKYEQSEKEGKIEFKHYDSNGGLTSQGYRTDDKKLLYTYKNGKLSETSLYYQDKKLSEDEAQNNLKQWEAELCPKDPALKERLKHHQNRLKNHQNKEKTSSSISVRKTSDKGSHIAIKAAKKEGRL